MKSARNGSLRILFLTRIALMKYRFQLPGFELPEAVRIAQKEFDECLATTLDRIADRIQGKAQQMSKPLSNALAALEEKVRVFDLERPEGVPTYNFQAFLALSRRIEILINSSINEIGSASLYSAR